MTSRTRTIITAVVLVVISLGYLQYRATRRAEWRAKIYKTEFLIAQIDKAYSNEITFIRGVYGTENPGEMNAKLGDAAQSHDYNRNVLDTRLAQERAGLARWTWGD